MVDDGWWLLVVSSYIIIYYITKKTASNNNKRSDKSSILSQWIGIVAMDYNTRESEAYQILRRLVDVCYKKKPNRFLLIKRLIVSKNRGVARAQPFFSRHCTMLHSSLYKKGAIWVPSWHFSCCFSLLFSWVRDEKTFHPPSSMLLS